MPVARLAPPVLVALLLSVSVAAQQVFTDQAAFIAASGPLGAESFECFPSGDMASSTPLETPVFVMTIQPVLSSALAPMNVQASPNPSGPHATDGTRFVQAGATPSINGQFDLTFNFASPVVPRGR